MAGIVERLRKGIEWTGPTQDDTGQTENLMDEAADEITRLRAEVARLNSLVTEWKEVGDDARNVMGRLLEDRTALRAEVASKNEQFQQYARKMETDIDALAAQNEKLRAALERLSCECPTNCDWEKHGDICPSWIARAALGDTP